MQHIFIKQQKTIKINLFSSVEINQTVEINQKPVSIWRIFIQIKWLNLNKNYKLSGILTCSIPIRLTIVMPYTEKPTALQL